jgi:ComF family protein
VDKKQKIKRLLLEVLFPSFCLGCQREGNLLCVDCQHTLDISEYLYCFCSKNPTRILPDSNIKNCRKCSGNPLDGLYSAVSYQERNLTKKLIYEFKYSGIKNLAPALASIITEHLFHTSFFSESHLKNSVLVPIPMESKKMRYRGYNQSEEIAKELSNIIDIPISLQSLKKTRPTRPQVGLSACERSMNVSNAFEVTYVKDILGKNIFLIDDVYTTGSTLNACATTLKTAGAKKVFGIVLARDTLQ